MTRTTEVECAHCGDEVEVELEAGADAYSLQGREYWCSNTCRKEIRGY